jgi:hypothetical protein
VGLKKDNSMGCLGYGWDKAVVCVCVCTCLCDDDCVHSYVYYYPRTWAIAPVLELQIFIPTNSLT